MKKRFVRLSVVMALLTLTGLSGYTQSRSADSGAQDSVLSSSAMSDSGISHEVPSKDGRQNESLVIYFFPEWGTQILIRTRM